MTGGVPFVRLRRIFRRATVLAFAAGFYAGCSSADKYRAAPTDGPRAKLLSVPFPAEYPPASLVTVIVYGGPGSWKRAALWDEYMILVRNPSDRPLAITAATLVDLAGIARAAESDPWRLEKMSKEICREYDRSGVAFAKEGASAALYVGGIAGGAAVFASVASTGGATVIVMQGPLALVTVPTYIMSRTISNRDARSDIEAEFHLRRLPLPATLAPGQTRLGCFFFPMVPNPRLLRFRWMCGDAHGDAELPLDFLHGLHTPSK